MINKWKCPVCEMETIGYGIQSHKDKHLRDKEYLAPIMAHNQKVEYDWSYDRKMIRDSFISHFPKIETLMIYQAFKEDIINFIGDLPLDNDKKNYFAVNALDSRDCFSNTCFIQLTKDLPIIKRPPFKNASWEDRVEFYNNNHI